MPAEWFDLHATLSRFFADCAHEIRLRCSQTPQFTWPTMKRSNFLIVFRWNFIRTVVLSSASPPKLNLTRENASNFCLISVLLRSKKHSHCAALDGLRINFICQNVISCPASRVIIFPFRLIAANIKGFGKQVDFCVFIELLNSQSNSEAAERADR